MIWRVDTRPSNLHVLVVFSNETCPSDDLLRVVDGRNFGTILADPPWQFQNSTGKVAPEHKRLSRYETMQLGEICDFPVEKIAADPSHLYLWVPNALLPDGLKVMEPPFLHASPRAPLAGMTQPSSLPAPSDPTATPDNTRWTGEKAVGFLEALAVHGQVAKAARCVGMSRQAAYRLRARAPRFARMWDMAQREAKERRADAQRQPRPVHPLLTRAALGVPA